MTNYYYVWLTIDGEKKGPHVVTIFGDGDVLMEPAPWFLEDATLEQLTNMGIIEMRMK